MFLHITCVEDSKRWARRKFLVKGRFDERSTCAMDLLESWNVIDGDFIRIDADDGAVSLMELVHVEHTFALEECDLVRKPCEVGVPWTRYMGESSEPNRLAKISVP